MLAQPERLAEEIGRLQRLVDDLGQQLAHRTAELEAAKDELRREAAERQRAEVALETRDLESRRILDNMPALVALGTATADVDFVNRQILEYTGKTPEEHANWRTSDLIHPDDLAGAIAGLQQAVSTGEPWWVEHRLRRFDGAYRWFESRGRPLKEPDGRVVRWCHTLLDIDDRKRAEEDVRRNEALLAEGQRLSMTGSFVWRLDTDEITFSAELRRIFELESDVPVTMERILVRVHPDDVPLVAEKIALARAGVVDHDYGVRLRRPDGSVKYLRTYAHAIRRPDGCLEFVGAMQDVTQSRRAEEALSAARSELTRVARITSVGALAASITHEVNQPLAGMITNASTCLRMLAADPPNIEGARETARRTIRDGHRASEVITRLRGLFAHRQATPEPVDLNDATREVIALSMSDLQRGQVVLRTELTDDLPAVTGDRIQLQQVILNLIRNAGDAMSEIEERPRQLVVRTEPEEDSAVRVSVRDTGVGIAQHAVDRLFEAFYTTKHDGMGIGLSVSRSIIESHRGRLWAAPNADGPGATFAFSLPCDPSMRD